MKNNLLYSFFLLACLGFCGNTQAQMGIGTNTPDPSAILELTGSLRGLLIPRMDTLGRSGIQKPAQGLMVYDTVYNMPFYFIGTNKENKIPNWVGLGAWRFYDNGRNSLRHVILDERVSNVGIGIANPLSKLTIMQEVSIGSNEIAPAFGLKVKGKIISEDTIRTNMAFVGPGTIPVGGIIMWSGDSASIPPGWALCNGKPSNGVSTPNLKGRFIVGMGQASGNGPTKYVVGSSGGSESVILDITQMPSHSHGVNDPGHSHGYLDSYPSHVDESTTSGGRSWNIYREDIADKSRVTSESTSKITISNTGTSQPHENRPPYYVLAYIMRVK